MAPASHGVHAVWPALATVPASQRTHAVAPVVGAYRLPSHAVQTVALVAAVKVPAAHGSHATAWDALMAVPAGQGRQAARRSTSLYVPGPHHAQAVYPVMPSVEVPSSQSEQVEAPAEAVPAAHGTQPERSSFTTVPPAHVNGVAMPVALVKVLPVQGKQVVAPSAGLYRPTGQRTHSLCASMAV